MRGWAKRPVTTNVPAEGMRSVLQGVQEKGRGKAMKWALHVGGAALRHGNVKLHV